MRTVVLIVVVFLAFFSLAFTSISDDKKVYKALSKKELYRLSIIKDVINAIIIILLLLFVFI